MLGCLMPSTPWDRSHPQLPGIPSAPFSHLHSGPHSSAFMVGGSEDGEAGARSNCSGTVGCVITSTLTTALTRGTAVGRKNT